MNRIARAFVALLTVLTLALGLSAAWRWWAGRAPAPTAAAPADSAQAGTRAVTLWFADESGDSLVAETRDMLEQEDLHERVAALVAALDQGPSRHGLALLPAGTRALHVFLDDRGLLTLDLSRAFQQGFHGGTCAEDLAIGSLVRTLGGNLPGVKRVLIVCGGASLVSLGGHVPLDRPLETHDWY